MTPNKWPIVCILPLLSIAFPAYAWNGAHEYLLSVPPKQQAAMLGEVVGDGCIGIRAFNMGIGSNNIGNWSVECADGRSFNAGVNPDGGGKVLECSMYKMLTKLSCFQKLENTK